MVEVLVALGVIFATLLVLAFSMFSSFAAVGFSRQRTQASALANQTIEQIRALPFDMLYMSQPDLAAGTDPQVVACNAPSGSYCFLTSTGRMLPSATFNSSPVPATTPLFPAHVVHPPNGSPGITAYTVKSYITIDPTDPNARIATVQVSWTPAQVGGVQPNLQVESKIFTSPFKDPQPGAATTTTVPLVHGYTANAQSQPGTISIHSNALFALNAADVTFNLPTASSYLSGNTTVGTSTGPSGHLVTGGTASSGVSAANLSVVNTPGALATATSPAGAATNGPNNDTKTPIILQSIPSSVNQCSAPLVCTLIGGTLNGGIAVGQVNSASALAASAAGNTPNIPTGVIPNNALGYGRATATQSGALSSNLAVNVANLLPLNLGLVNLVPSGNATPDMATVNQNGSAGVPLGQTFNASATKSFTELDILSGLPVVGTLLKLTGFSSTASACAGPGSCSSASAASAGQLVIAGIANPISLASVVPVTVPPVNVSAGILNIAVTTTVAIGPATTTGTSSASVTSPLVVNVHLGISTLLGPVVDLTIAVNLGTVTTSASYS